MRSTLWYAISTNGTFIVSLIFGYYIYKNNKRSPINRWYTLCCLCVGLFCFDSFLIAFIPSYKLALLLGRFFYFAPIFSSVCYIHWVFAITETKNKKTSAYLKFAVIGGVVLTIISFTPFFIKGIDTGHFFIKFIIPGPLYPLFIGFIFLNGLVGLDTFLKNIRKAAQISPKKGATKKAITTKLHI